MPNSLVIETGDTFGSWTIVGEACRTPCGRRRFTCKCACGSTRDTNLVHLVSGRSRDCGCGRKATLSMVKATHRMVGTPTHQSWRAMVQRCRNVNHASYKNYGGRGISICPYWREFDNFFTSMGARPLGKTLDRIENNGNYEPGNCRWATPIQQARNKRKRSG